MPKYSIVVPFHNEEENVTALYDRLKAVMEQIGDSFELVLVDDGATWVEAIQRASERIANLSQASQNLDQRGPVV